MNIKPSIYEYIYTCACLYVHVLLVIVITAIIMLIIMYLYVCSNELMAMLGHMIAQHGEVPRVQSNLLH